MSYQNILVEDKKGIRVISLNRANSLNALNYDVINELLDILDKTKLDSQIRVVIFKGEGKAFCAGDDLKGMSTDNQPAPVHALRRAELGYSRVILALRNLDKPVIAQIHGYALGAGCDLALACDLVYAEVNTKFGFVFAKRGLVAGTILFPKSVGYQKACEYLFSGNTFSASEAKDLGIVNGIYDDIDELSSRVEAKAIEFSNAPTAAIGLIKRAINDGIGTSLYESANIQDNVIAHSYGTHDYEEGKNAFKEKREPKYIGE